MQALPQLGHVVASEHVDRDAHHLGVADALRLPAVVSPGGEEQVGALEDIDQLDIQSLPLRGCLKPGTVHAEGIDADGLLAGLQRTLDGCLRGLWRALLGESMTCFCTWSSLSTQRTSVRTGRCVRRLSTDSCTSVCTETR